MERPRVSDKFFKGMIYAVVIELFAVWFLFTFWPGIYRMIAKGL